MGVSPKKRGKHPKPSILIGFSIIFTIPKVRCVFHDAWTWISRLGPVRLRIRGVQYIYGSIPGKYIMFPWKSARKPPFWKWYPFGWSVYPLMLTAPFCKQFWSGFWVPKHLRTRSQGIWSTREPLPMKKWSMKLVTSHQAIRWRLRVPFRPPGGLSNIWWVTTKPQHQTIKNSQAVEPEGWEFFGSCRCLARKICVNLLSCQFQSFYIYNSELPKTPCFDLG